MLLVILRYPNGALYQHAEVCDHIHMSGVMLSELSLKFIIQCSRYSVALLNIEVGVSMCNLMHVAAKLGRAL